ncbi:MAG: ribonuclease III [Ruminococcaceae bacterium]|nr:ribonuclease III [Oscillospiraceae bacterium]
MENYFAMHMTLAQVNEISNLGLAHIGDGVYELLCRAYLCDKGGKKVNNLHKNTVKLVNAVTQAKVADKLLPVLSEEELAFFRRGKNAHTHAAPKAATPQEYARATGLEALFGALYLLGRTERLNELFLLGMEETNGL